MPNALEFKITSDLNQNIQPITCNFDELKTALTAEMGKYKDLVIQEEDLRFAKDSRAKINKVSKAINDQRLAVKKQVLKPFEEFEAQCKELDSICTEASESLDVQIKKFEDAQKQQKAERIKSFFLASVPIDLSNYLAWEQVFNPRFLNATFDEKKAQEEIVSAIEICQKEVNAIRELNSPFETAVLDYYSRKRNLADALYYSKELEQKAAAEAERRKREEEEKRRKKEEEAQRMQQAKLERIQEEIPVEPVQMTTEETVEQVKAALEGKQIEEKPKQYAICLKIFGSKEELVALKEYIVEHNLNYEKIK